MDNASNNFTGTVSIVGGGLRAALDTATAKGSLGDLDNDILLDGGVLRRLSGDRLQATRTITIGESGGALDGSMTVYGEVTGPGCLIVNRKSAITLAAANTYQGGTRVVNIGEGVGSLTVNAGATVGTGDVQLECGAQATFLADTNVASDAAVHCALYASAAFESAAPAIGGLYGSGDVELGTSSAATTLTVGGGNSSSIFHGRIAEADSDYPSGLTKTGSGTFTLYGAHAYTGATTVDAGKLLLMGSVASNLTVNAGGTLGGRGHVGGDLDVNGTMEVVLRGDDDYDFITVGGDSDLMGSQLTVSLADGYSPALDTEWRIVQSGTVAANFDSVPDGYITSVDNGDIILRNPAQGTLFILE
jgi:autotransporter-associated beta strand protein